MDVRFTSSPASSPSLTWRPFHASLFCHRRDTTPPLLKKLILSKTNSNYNEQSNNNTEEEDSIDCNIRKKKIFKPILIGNNRPHKYSVDIIQSSSAEEEIYEKNLQSRTSIFKPTVAHNRMHKQSFDATLNKSKKKQMKGIEKRIEREREKQYLKELEQKHQQQLKMQQQQLFEEERKALFEQEELMKQLKNNSNTEKHENVKNAFKEISQYILIEAERLANEYQRNTNQENQIEFKSVLEVYKMILIPDQYFSSALSYQELKQEYRKQVLHLHPDKNQHPQAIESFQKLNRIYENAKSQIKSCMW